MMCVKDCLLKYVHQPSVSCHIEMNVDRAIHGQGRFKSCIFQVMWQWCSLHKLHQADSAAGIELDGKMAQEACISVKQWLMMKERDINTKMLQKVHS